MTKSVLGNDPFASFEPAPAAESAEPVSVKIKPATAEKRPSKPVGQPRRPRQSTPGKAVPGPAAPPIDVQAITAAVVEAVEAKLEPRFASLEDRLSDALDRLDGIEKPESEKPLAHGATAVTQPDASRDTTDSSYDDSSFAETDASDGEDDDGGFMGFLDDEADQEFDAEDSLLGAGGTRAYGAHTSPSLLSGLRDLFSPTRLGQRLGERGMRGRSDDVDEFGMDPVYFERASQIMDWLYEKYWRVDAEGLEHVPDEGRGLIVGNHSGTLPFDGVMIATAARLHHPAGRSVRALAEDMFSTLPFVAPFLTRLGAVRACPENAERLLNQDELVVVFPEGVKGTGKYYHDRYQLQRFGRGGFIKLCLRTGSPLIPVAVLGAEEIYPIIAKADWIGKPLGLPYTPLTPTWPWLGALGLLPLPSKWRIRFGEPISFEEYGPDAIEDDILINHLKEEVRQKIQGMLDDMLAERNSVWFG